MRSDSQVLGLGCTVLSPCTPLLCFSVRSLRIPVCRRKCCSEVTEATGAQESSEGPGHMLPQTESLEPGVHPRPLRFAASASVHGV